MAQEKRAGGPTTHLARTLGLYDVTMIGVAAMIGAGIFVLTGRAAGLAGPAFLLAFTLNGVVAMLTAGAYAELGSSFPEAGGAFTWVAQGFHKVFSFLTGWLGWFSHTVACSVYALGFGVYFLEFLNFFGIVSVEGMKGAYPFWIRIGAVVIAVVLGWVNFGGVSETGKLGSIMSTTKVAILLLFAGFGFVKVLSQPDLAANYTPFFVESGGFSAPILILLAMGITYMAFEGYEVIVQAGEETKNPEKNIPKAIFISILVVLPVYLLVGGATMGALDGSQIKDYGEALAAHPEVLDTNANLMAFLGERVVVEAADQFMLPVKFPGTAYSVGMFLVILAGLTSTLSALNGTIFSSSRVAFAMGRQGLVPHFLGRIHPKKKTPAMGIIVTVIATVFMAVAIPLAAVSAAAAVMFLLLFTMVNAALIRLRKTRPDVPRAYKLPGVPWVPGIAIVLQLTIAAGVFFLPEHPLASHGGGHGSPGAIAWAVTGGWMVLGLLLYAGPFRKLQPMEQTRVVSETAFHAKEVWRVLLASGYQKTILPLCRVASALAKARQGDVHAVSVAVIPETTPLTAVGYSDLGAASRCVEETKGVLEELGARVNSTLVVGHQAETAIAETAISSSSDLILMGWRGGRKKKGFFLGDTLDGVLGKATARVAVLKARGEGPWKKIFVAVGGGPNTRAVLEIATDLAKGSQASLTLGCVSRSESELEDCQSRLDKAEELIGVSAPDVEVGKTVIAGPRVVEGLLGGAKGHDMLILGAAESRVWEKARMGGLVENLSRRFAGSVLLIRGAQGRARRFVNRLLEE